MGKAASHALISNQHKSPQTTPGSSGGLLRERRLAAAGRGRRLVVGVLQKILRRIRWRSILRREIQVEETLGRLRFRNLSASDLFGRSRGRGKPPIREAASDAYVSVRRPLLSKTWRAGGLGAVNRPASAGLADWRSRGCKHELPPCRHRRGGSRSPRCPSFLQSGGV